MKDKIILKFNTTNILNFYEIEPCSVFDLMKGVWVLLNCVVQCFKSWSFFYKNEQQLFFDFQ